MSDKIVTSSNPLAKRSAREPGELYEKLLEQLSFLDASAKGFDEGNAAEAARLATQIRVLVYKDDSLLSILGIRDSLRYVGTAIDRELYTAAQTSYYGTPPAAYAHGEVGFLEILPDDDGSYGFYAPLVEHRFPPSSPQAVATPTSLAFDDWWGAPVIETGKFTYFSRGDLIRIMANQDGGAHVSEKLDTQFAAFKKDNFGIRGQFRIGGKPFTEEERHLPPHVRNDPAAASARQIAYELTLTLHRYIDNLAEDHPLRLNRKSMYEFKRVVNPNALRFVTPRIIAAEAPPVPKARPVPAVQTSQPAQSIPDYYANARTLLRGTYSFDRPRARK